MQGSGVSDGERAPLMLRRRRWLIAIGATVAVLTVYVGVLTWVTRRLETDIQKSIRPLPAAMEDHRPAE